MPKRNSEVCPTFMCVIFYFLQRNFFSSKKIFYEDQILIYYLWPGKIYYTLLFILIDFSIPFVIQGWLIFLLFSWHIYFKGACLLKIWVIVLRNCSNEWFASSRWMSRMYSQSIFCKSHLKLSWAKDLKVLVSIFLGFVLLCTCFQILCFHWYCL